MSIDSVNQYFVQRKGRIKGPYSREKVESGLAAGKLRVTDEISENLNGGWQPLGRWVKAAESDSQASRKDEASEDDDDLDEFITLASEVPRVVRREAFEPTRPERVPFDWGGFLGNLRKPALALAWISVAGLVLWFVIPMIRQAIDDLDGYRQAVAQLEIVQPKTLNQPKGEPADNRHDAKPENQLFEPALRAAKRYDGHLSRDSSLPLTKELRAVESSLKTDAERLVYERLKMVEELQIKMNKLAYAKEILKKEFASTAKELKTQAAELDSQRNVVGSLYGSQLHRHVLDDGKIFNQLKLLSENNCIVLAIDPPQSIFRQLYSNIDKIIEAGGVRELVAEYNLESQTNGRVSYVPAEDLVGPLERRNQKLIDQVSLRIQLIR